ncbi:hypothetical protein L207DRAFT_627115 [Hyaloscypha variabilis F]|uniref:Uncharacterized protein n=1 Tax=Hyaloscypha variabilis (strain UAMH 11265 / GT02V1 / F) TaxID=1149755 RepID=A0A2J6SC86_HYAVF|nr:hypothetical protein L207DRAFT_627115 [Hyaloscypha variabilis F]
MCRTILEVGIPTVVCLPRRLTVGCSCQSPLQMVINVRGKGKAALKMPELAKEDAVTRAKTVITSLYHQQTARYMAEARRENWNRDSRSFITSIFNQVPGMQPAFNLPGDTITSPGMPVLRPTDSPLKSPLRSPMSPNKSMLKSPLSTKRANQSNPESRGKKFLKST